MTGWKRHLLFLGGLLVLFLAAAYVVSGIFLPASRYPRQLLVEVPHGASAREIARRLENQDVIRSRHAFLLAARALGQADKLQAGEYQLDPAQGLVEILDKIAQGDAIAHWVTIPEGYTLRQVAELLERRGLADARRFTEVATTGSRRFETIPSPPIRTLEGYLFPDTYKFPAGTGEEALVRVLLGNFRRRVVEGMAEELRASPRPLHEIVTIAALVEREAKVDEDRAKIAGVIENRLRDGMRLQIDATLLYALGRNHFVDVAQDKRVESPYNTYLHPGLPPGPICNPGLEAIRAALAPAEVSYLYYVTLDDETHLFADTYEEHQANIRRGRDGGR